MINILDKVIAIIQKVLKIALVTIGVSMLIIAWIHIFCRFILNSSLSWSEELLKVMLIWFCLFSTSIIAAERGHVSIVIFKEKMPKPIGQLLTLISQIFIYLISFMVVYIGFRMVVNTLWRSTPAANIPYPIVYGAIPISFAVITIYEFRNLLTDIKKYKDNEEL